MHIIKKLTASALIGLLLAACGGGSSNNAADTQSVTQNTSSDTVITGMASKGPIDGTAAIYAIKDADGNRGALLKGGIPVIKGEYSANIGKYDVPIIIEVSGSYTDEATGNVMTLEKPLRTALAGSVTTTKIAVTPLTELAVQKAEQQGGALSRANINDAHKLVSDIFKFDIISTLPVVPTDAAAVAAASQNQKDYTLALAAISQLSRTQPLATTLTNISNNMSSSGMNSTTVVSFQKAVTDFKSSSNGIVFKDSNLAAINGARTAGYTLELQGIFVANSMKGIQFEIVIPQGVTLRTDVASGVPLSGIVTASSSSAAADASLLSWYNPSDGVLHFGMTTSKGIGVGDLATITCDIVPGWTKPAASTFSVRNIKAVDGTTATIPGVSVTVK